MRLSYSKLSAFIGCGFLYRLKYIEKMPTRPKPHLGFGRILHATLNRFYTLDTDNPSLDDLLYLYKGYWKTESTAYKRHYAKGLSILKRYYELNMKEYHKAVYLEQPFEVPIGYHILAGRFDKVDRIDNNTYEIIDYKAAKQVATQAQADSDLQLGIYGLAFRFTTGTLPLLSLYFLPENVKITSRRTDKEIHRIRSGLESIVDRLMSGEHFEPRAGMECKWCDYKQYCPLKTENPLPLPKREIQPELF